MYNIMDVKVQASNACEVVYKRSTQSYTASQPTVASALGVDRYGFFRADTDYYRSSRPITDILNWYTCLV